ncbi:TPA: hypothetical protein ACQZB7_003380 [Escherichia coli]
MLALRIMQGIAKTLAEHVLDLKHSPLSKQAMKRQMLRLWAEYSLGTINKLIDMKSKDNGSLHECNDEEKRFVQRLKMIRYDIHSMLQSVNADI